MNQTGGCTYINEIAETIGIENNVFQYFITKITHGNRKLYWLQRIMALLIRYYGTDWRVDGTIFDKAITAMYKTLNDEEYKFNEKGSFFIAMNSVSDDEPRFEKVWWLEEAADPT